MNITDQLVAWIEQHEAQGHDAFMTVAGAPGTGLGTYCATERIHGPSTIRILTPEEVR